MAAVWLPSVVLRGFELRERTQHRAVCVRGVGGVRVPGRRRAACVAPTGTQNIERNETVEPYPNLYSRPLAYECRNFNVRSPRMSKSMQKEEI